MDPLLSTQQEEQLKTWAVQRDEILQEISVLNTEKEERAKEVRDLSASYTEIADRIQQSIGRLSELDKKEEEYINVVSDSIPPLEAEKSKLETEVSNFKKEIAELILRKDGLTKDIILEMQVNDVISEKSKLIEQIVGHVTSISDKNTKELDSSLSLLKTNIQNILDLSSENIEKHNKILNEIPKLFVELQRKSLVREVINK